MGMKLVIDGDIITDNVQIADTLNEAFKQYLVISSTMDLLLMLQISML